jgi:hypothetical protein
MKNIHKAMFSFAMSTSVKIATAAQGRFVEWK